MHQCYVCTKDPAFGNRLTEMIADARSDWTCTVFPDSESIRESLIRTKPDMIIVDMHHGSSGLMQEINQLASSAWTILVGEDIEWDLPQLPESFRFSDIEYFLNNPPETYAGQQRINLDENNMVTNILLSHIWTGLLNQWIRPERAMIKMAAQGIGLAGIENMHVLPILVKTIHQQRAEATREQSAQDHFFFENLFAEKLLGGTHHGVALDRFEQKWAVLLYIEDTPLPEESLYDRCSQAMFRASEEGWQLGFVIGAPVLPEELYAQWLRLEELALSEVGYSTSVRTLHDAPHNSQSLELPDMRTWRKMLEAGEFRAADESIEAFVLSLASEQELTTQWLLQFRNAIVEETYRTLHVHGIPVEEVFRSDQGESTTFNRSAVSVQQLLAWISDIMSAMERFRHGAEPDSVVQQAQKYILQHLDQNLSREEIAKNVFVSCGYLSRLFKRELHINMSEYIFSERMKVAQQMLEQTDLYVTTIAMNVGYSNFPYFSTQFKQYTGYSPVEYRKRSRIST